MQEDPAGHANDNVLHPEDFNRRTTDLAHSIGVKVKTPSPETTQRFIDASHQRYRPGGGLPRNRHEYNNARGAYIHELQPESRKFTLSNTPMQRNVKGAVDAVIADQTQRILPGEDEVYARFGIERPAPVPYQRPQYKAPEVREFPKGHRSSASPSYEAAPQRPGGLAGRSTLANDNGYDGDAERLNRARAAAAEAAGTVGRGLGYAAGAMGVIEGADEWRRHSRTTPEENRAYVGGVRREDLPSVRDAGQRLREGETTYTHVQGHEVQTTRDGHGVHHTVLPPATGHTPDGGPVY